MLVAWGLYLNYDRDQRQKAADDFAAAIAAAAAQLPADIAGCGRGVDVGAAKSLKSAMPAGHC